MRSNILTLAVLAVLSASALAPAAHADLIGSTVTLTSRLPELSTTFNSAGSATVTSATFFPNGSLAGFPYQFEVTGDQIVMTVIDSTNTFPSFDFAGFAFDFSGAPTIASATVDSSSTLTPVAVLFTGTEVAMNLSGIQVFPDATTIIDIDTTPVPEPSSIALLSSGLLFLDTLRRRASHA